MKRLRRPPVCSALRAVALLCQISNATASEIRDYAIVVDGDTLLIREVNIRLAGIEAPKPGQKCTLPGNVEWDCGADAKRMLAEKIGREAVSCRQLYIDDYDQLLATCAVSNGDDLAAAMVRSGYALADGRAQRYLAEEKAAHMAGIGMWSGSFQTPWEWRAQQPNARDE